MSEKRQKTILLVFMANINCVPKWLKKAGLAKDE